MKIQTRLTITFVGLVALILLAASVAIYVFQNNSRHDELYAHLTSKARNSATLLISDKVDTSLLRLIDSTDIGALPNEKIFVYNENLKKIYSSRQDSDMVLTHGLYDQIVAGKEVHFRQGDYEGVGLLVNEHKHNFVAVAEATDFYGHLKLEKLRDELLAIYGFSIIVILIAGRLFAIRALQPLSTMIKKVDSIDYANLNSRIEGGRGRDEMAQLARTFNSMLDRLETTFKVQRDFVANASHELRTPLTSITGQLEVMLMKERSPQEYRESLESVLDDIKNLSLTSNRLLMLAQASSRMTEFGFTDIRIDEILWQSQSEVLKRKPEYKIEINFYDLPEDEQELTIKGNEPLLRTMVTNLMDNGCKYSGDQTVKVQLSVYKDLVQIIFSDAGVGIAKEDLPHIFEPFYRTSNAITVKGHGLGLSLVQRIINIHNGKIKVLSEPGVGSAFIITLPLAEPHIEA